MSAFQPRRPNPSASSGTFGAGGNSAARNSNNSAASNSYRPQQQQQGSVSATGGGGQRSTGGFSQQSLAPSNTGAPAVDSPLVIDGAGGRILCVADVRGNLKTLNDLAAKYNAQAIIHTGDFGFYIDESLDRISDKTLRHIVQYSSLIPQDQRTKLLAADQPRGTPISGANYPTINLRAQISSSANPLISEFQLLMEGKLRLNVPVFTVWGACEDVAVIERIRTGEYQIPNLQVLDEATTISIHVGEIRLRLFGLGGAVVLHKLFDNGDGAATIAGGQGIMWTTMLQIGELVDTAQKTFDPTETRVLVTHASPGREGLLAQLAVVLKADLTVSAGLHFRYGISYNEFGVQHDSQNYRNKMVSAKTAFGEVWEGVKTQVEEVIDAQQRILLEHALSVTNRVPSLSTATGAVNEEYTWKNTWNWNLPDAAHGALVFDVKEGNLGAETYSTGFNFGYRKGANAPLVPTQQPAIASPATKPQNVAPASSAPSVTPQTPTAQAPSSAGVPPRIPGSVASGHAAAPSAGPTSNIRSPPTGPALSAPLTGIRSPPVGPKAYQQSHPHTHQHSSSLHTRGGRPGGIGRGTGTSGSLTNGSAPNTDTEPKDTGGRKFQQQQQQQHTADKDRPVSGSTPPVGDSIRTSGNVSGPEAKNRKPRPLKKTKGPGGATSLTAGEASGAEALTSGNESGGQNAKKIPGHGSENRKKDVKSLKDKDKDRDQLSTPRSGPAPTPATTAAPASQGAAPSATVTATPASAPASASAGASGWDAPSSVEVPGIKSSGDEALSPSTGGGSNRGVRGRGGRGGAGGGRGRGGYRGGRGGTGSTPGGGGESPAPSAPVSAPASAPAPPPFTSS